MSYHNPKLFDTLEPPTNVTATIDDGEVILSFTAAPSPADSYEAQVSTDSGFASAIEEISSTSPVSFTGLTNLTPYHARVRALKNRYNPSAWRTLAGNGTVTPSAYTYDLLFEGDSITAFAANGGQDSNYPAKMQADLAAQSQYTNFANLAVGGQSIGTGSSSNDMLYPAQIAAVVAARTPGHVPITFLYAGVNDFQSGSSAATVYARLTALHRAHNTTNVGKTVAFTIMAPRSPGSADHTAMYAQIDACNDMIRAGYITDFGASVLVDVQTDPQLGGYNAPLSSRWFLDEIHPNTYGSQRLANLGELALPIIAANSTGIVTYTPTLTNFAQIHADVTNGVLADSGNVISAIPTTGSWGTAYGKSYLKLPQNTDGSFEVEVSANNNGCIGFTNVWVSSFLLVSPRISAGVFGLVPGQPISYIDNGSLNNPSGGPTLSSGDWVRIKREGSLFKMYHRTSAGSYGASIFTYGYTTDEDMYIGFDIRGGEAINHPHGTGLTDN